MSAEDIAAIAERHVPIQAIGEYESGYEASGEDECAADAEDWPCDTRKVLDALERAKRHAEHVHGCKGGVEGDRYPL